MNIDWSVVCMVLACVLFLIAGVLRFSENWKTGTALVCLGVANALLLWEAR